MRETIRNEARFWWQSSWRPCKWTLLACLVGFFLLSVVDTIRMPNAKASDWMAVPVVAIVGGLYVGAFVAPAVGLTALVWRLVGHGSSCRWC